MHDVRKGKFPKIPLYTVKYQMPCWESLLNRYKIDPVPNQIVTGNNQNQLRQRIKKTVLLESRWVGASSGSARIDGQQGFTICLV